MTLSDRRLPNEEQHVIPSQVSVSCTTEGQIDQAFGIGI